MIEPHVLRTCVLFGKVQLRMALETTVGADEKSVDRASAGWQCAPSSPPLPVGLLLVFRGQRIVVVRFIASSRPAFVRRIHRMRSAPKRHP